MALSTPGSSGRSKSRKLSNGSLQGMIITMITMGLIRASLLDSAAKQDMVGMALTVFPEVPEYLKSLKTPTASTLGLEKTAELSIERPSLDAEISSPSLRQNVEAWKAEHLSSREYTRRIKQKNTNKIIEIVPSQSLNEIY